MMDNNVGKKVSTGKIYNLPNEINVDTIEWVAHPSFSGVSLKHLVYGRQTNNQFSYHLVKVQAGHEIGQHAHPGKWELHEIIGGSGVAFLGEEKMLYRQGVSSVLPADSEHRVVAERDDLYILATFVPALV